MKTTTPEPSTKSLRDQCKFLQEQMRWERDLRMELEEDLAALEEDIKALKEEIRLLRWSNRL